MNEPTLTSHAEDDVLVLAVDDVRENLDALAAVLTPRVRMLRALGGRQALELLLEHDVALALIDVNMPEMDGLRAGGADARIGAQPRRPDHFPDGGRAGAPEGVPRLRGGRRRFPVQADRSAAARKQGQRLHRAVPPAQAAVATGGAASPAGTDRRAAHRRARARSPHAAQRHRHRRGGAAPRRAGRPAVAADRRDHLQLVSAHEPSHRAAAGLRDGPSGPAAGAASADRPRRTCVMPRCRSLSIATSPCASSPPAISPASGIRIGCCRSSRI